jgi:hypothetical protein
MAAARERLVAEKLQPLRELAAERARVRKLFGELKIVDAQVSDLTGLKVGDTVEARVHIDLAGLSAERVQVELVLGHTRGATDLRNPIQVVLAPSGKLDGGRQLFRGTQRIARSGNFAYGLRVRVRNDGALDAGQHDLVQWA